MMPIFEMIIAIAVGKAMTIPDEKYFQNERKNNSKLVKSISVSRSLSVGVLKV